MTYKECGVTWGNQSPGNMQDTRRMEHNANNPEVLKPIAPEPKDYHEVDPNLMMLADIIDHHHHRLCSLEHRANRLNDRLNNLVGVICIMVVLQTVCVIWQL